MAVLGYANLTSIISVIASMLMALDNKSLVLSGVMRVTLTNQPFLALGRSIRWLRSYLSDVLAVTLPSMTVWYAPLSVIKSMRYLTVVPVISPLVFWFRNAPNDTRTTIADRLISLICLT